MSTLKIREIKAALLRKGFVQRNNDHEYFSLHVEGKKTSIFTKVSHGESEIRDPLIHKMAKQIRLSNDQYVKFIECSISGDAYVAILRSKSEI